LYFLNIFFLLSVAQDDSICLREGVFYPSEHLRLIGNSSLPTKIP
jgi:hypothetical protein